MQGYLLGKAPLGQGQAGAVGNKPRFLGPPYYLLNDTFTTDRAAGAVNSTNAEPGPGVRTVTDTGNNLSITGGKLSFNGQVGSGNPRHLHSVPVVARVAGRVLTFNVNLSATSKIARIGWATTGFQSACRSGVLFLNNGTILTVESANNGPVLAAYGATTDYQLWIILRATGHLVFIKGGAWTYPTLLWAGAIDFDPELLAIISQNSTGTMTYDYLRVPAARWLPTPLASDGFSAWGTTDGFGHAEGVAGGQGSGGSGLAWTNQIGTWGDSAGKAFASALSGGIAAATLDSGKTDALTTAKVTRSGGVAGVMAAYVDANNHVRAVHNGTNAQLIKRVSGSDTNVISTAATYAAGAEIRAIREGTAYRLYYNNALIGSQQTISDAVFNSVTLQGIYTTDAANTLDDFVVRARGTGGEYSALDNF